MAFRAGTRYLVAIKIQTDYSLLCSKPTREIFVGQGFKVYKFFETGLIPSHIFCDMSACFSSAYIKTFV